MKLDVSRVLLSLNNEPLKLPDSTNATLKWAAVEALMSTPTNETLAAAEKVTRFKLAQKVQNAEALVELSIEDVAKIKDLIGKFFPVNVTGASYDLIESQATPNPA